MNFTKIIFLLSGFIIFTQLIIAQTITSKSSGGIWEDANTWVGSVVPNETNNVIIEGIVSVTSSSRCRDLTINSGKVLQNGGNLGWVTLQVQGNLTNNGTVRNNPSGYSFYIEVQGNITNNGTWTLSGVYLPGAKKQFISMASGKTFESEFYKRYQSGWCDTNQITASSPLTFTKSFDLSGTLPDLRDFRGTINMNGYTLTMSGNANIFKGDILNASNINISQQSVLANVTFKGAVVIHGTASIINSEVTFEGDVTIADTLQNGGDLGWVTPVFKGKFINNGVIRNNSNGNELCLELMGDVVNNGKWINSSTYLPGKNVQHLSQSAGKSFECNLFKRYASGWCDTNKIIASSSLTFRKKFELDGTLNDLNTFRGKLDMAGNTLIMSGSAYITRGTVINAADINVSEESAFGDITYCGQITLYGTASIINSNVNFIGDVTIADTLQNGGDLGWVTPVITGTLVNRGVIRNNPGGNSLNLTLNGSIYNYGSWTAEAYLKTNGSDRGLTGIFHGGVWLEKTGDPASGSFQVSGLFETKSSLTIEEGARLEIPQGGIFHNYAGMNNRGSIKNEGSFSSLHIFRENNIIPTDPAQFIEVNVTDRKNADTVIVTCFSRNVHPRLTSAIKRYWKIQSAKAIGGYALKLFYNDDLLNNNNEAALEAYHSADSGKTWKKISTPVNSSRDTENNIFIVGNENYPVTAGSGDIILSSGGEVFKGYSIQTSVGGRKQIRVGPPNRYTVSYWNNTDQTTDKFFIKMNTNRGVHIQSIITKKIEDGSTIDIPVDSLTYPNNKDEVILLVQNLAPKEVRSFDVILTALPDPSNLQKAAFEPISFTAAALWIGGAILEEYVSNTVVEGCYEVWRPVRSDETLTQATKKALSNSMQKAVTIENGAKGIVKKGVEEVIEKTGKAVVWPVSLAMDAFDCLGNAVKGMKDYVNGNFDQSSKELEKVTSWDPNAKEGPAGFGTKGYMAAAAPMTYTIYFENKKEASAPAWKIVVYDTLDQSVFDPSTVKFGKMSHSMGVPKRNGNIVSWEFLNIELPPNIIPPQGEGWVQFTVMPKPNLATGTVLKNSATIIFDLNKPLSTNLAVNTLDFDAPVTTPLSLNKVAGKNEVELTWKADDKNGAGIKNSQVFMASENAPYTIAAQSDSGKARIQVVPGMKYRFYVLSRDNVGNLEQNPSKILEIATEVEEQQVLPAGFALYQNYPNPFNPVTTIRYSLSDMGWTTLKIYNLLGQEVKLLVNAELKAGSYSAGFNASELASGIYIYQLRQGARTESRKMIVLK